MVGDEVFAVAIHAGSEGARIDWRSDYPALSYEVIDLPSDVEKALRAVRRRVEEAARFWNNEGRPSYERFGITATPQSQQVWYDNPAGPHHWPLRSN